MQLDVTDDASVAAAMKVIEDAESHLDVLVNNAGLGLAALSGPEALQVFDTNAVGIIRVTQAALSLLRRSANPVVVNLSSSLGSFWAVTNPGRPASRDPAIIYGASKVAVSMLTLQYAHAVPEVKFNAVDPGPNATDMTAGRRGRPDEESAGVIVRMATIGPDGPTGTFAEDVGQPPGEPAPGIPGDHLDRVTAAHPVRGQAHSQDQDDRRAIIVKLTTRGIRARAADSRACIHR